MSNPFTVSPLKSEAGVLIGYGVWCQSDLGGGAFVATTNKTGPEGLRAMEDQANRRNAQAGHSPVQPREFKRTPKLFKGIWVDPVGEAQWSARIGRFSNGPARDTAALAVADRYASA